jgi:hypothetical protein
MATIAIATFVVALLVVVQCVVRFLPALAAFRARRLIVGAVLPRVIHAGAFAGLVNDAPVLDLAVSRAAASEQGARVDEAEEQPRADQHNEGAKRS